MAYSLKYIQSPKSNSESRYRYFVTGLDNAIYNNAEKAISPMKAAGKQIAKILRTHLGITNSEGYVRGVASNRLRRDLDVVYVNHKVNREGAFGVDRRVTGFSIDVDFQLVNPKSNAGYDYGLAIGADEGYTFKPSAEDLARWIRKKRDRRFYWTDGSGKKRYPANLKQARRAAFAMLSKLKGTQRVILPNWYEINADDDTSQIDRTVVRTSNLFMKEVGEQLRKQYKK